MFIGSFSVDVKPFAIERELHFLLADFGGFIVVEGVGILVPGAGVYLYMG